VENIADSDVHKVAKSFEGEIEQVPPAYSAVKVDGVRAYRKARDNKEVVISPRLVKINSFQIKRIQMPEVEFIVSCSTGTYIRSLVYDFGIKLNNGAHLGALERTRIGQFDLENAWKLDDVLK